MKSLLILMLFILVGCGETPKEKKPLWIEGTFESDREKTMKFNRDKAKMTEEQFDALSQMVGNAKVIVSGNKSTLIMKEYELKVSGNSIKVPGSEVTVYFETLYHNEHKVITKSTYENIGEYVSVNYKEEGYDGFWLYIAQSPIVDLHAREYWKRVKD